MSTLDPHFRTSPLVATLGHHFHAAGEELFLVGGAVRDALLGMDSDEADFATSALPDRTFELLKSFPEAHPYRIGEKFGTIGAQIGEFTVEVTTYRVGETYLQGSRKPDVTFGSSLLDDLTRRDFTINAMAVDVRDLRVIDPLGGMADLHGRLIRSVGNPDRRFEEDPLRLLRAVRFAARLGFRIQEETWAAMARNAPALNRISRERVRDELSRMLKGDTPSLALMMMCDCGLLGTAVPQLMELTRMPDHGPRHPLSLWEHEMRVVDSVPARLELRWAALLHDIAKPATRTTEPSGRPRFFHHEEVGADFAREILTDLRYPKSFVDAVAMLVGSHMQLHAYSSEWTDGAVRRLMIRMGSCLDDAIELVRADAAGHSLDGISYNAPKFDELEARIHALRSEPVQRLRSPLNGEDLMQQYGRPPGPWIRKVKEALEEEVIEGRLVPEDRDGAWRVADAALRQSESH